MCAERGGGLVFPPLYYGESRLEALMEANAADREAIAAAMELSPDNFLPDRHPFTATDQALNYHKLLLHILAEAESLGFELGVIVAGHYPLIDHARAAVLQYNQRENVKMLAWAFVDYLLVQDQYPHAGDHAAGWETSHVMALHPQTVDLSLLPPRGDTLIGIGGTMLPSGCYRRIRTTDPGCRRGDRDQRSASPAGQPTPLPWPWVQSPRGVVASLLIPSRNDLEISRDSANANHLRYFRPPYPEDVA